MQKLLDMLLKFDKWFHSQDKLVQVILLIIPVVGWFAEILVRWSAWLKNKVTISLVVALVVTFTGWLPFIHWIDALWVALYNKLLLED